MSKKLFFYREKGALKNIDPQDIIILQADRNYVRFKTHNLEIMVRTTLTAALKLLEEYQFVQINRFQVVSLNYIEYVGKDFIMLYRVPDFMLTLTKQFYPGVMKHITVIEAIPGKTKMSKLGADNKVITKIEKDQSE